jgi:hypothetical protein
MKRQRKAAPPPPPPPPPTDTLGDFLIAQGFVHNDYLLDLNGTLESPPSERTERPWNLPSRLFRFPIEISKRWPDGNRRIGLVHPELVDHPLVQRVAPALETIGLTLDPAGGPNQYGYTRVRIGTWWHACDLGGEGMWTELFETRRFTTDDDIVRAVVHRLDYSGKTGTAQARSVLRQLGVPEPADREDALRLLMRPSSTKPDGGGTHWPLNQVFSADPAAVAWGRVHGLEAGWFVYQSKFLQWSERGRSIWDAVNRGDRAAPIVGKGGQLEFSL